MRGIHLSTRTSSVVCGIIHACAGNTLNSRPLQQTEWDHPRLCGEYQKLHQEHFTTLGSSPPVRGILFLPDTSKDGYRIIPACAGNTLMSMDTFIISEDHPRLCGEYCHLSKFSSGMPGSSPPVRGILLLFFLSLILLGIIPACAGNTTSMKRRNVSLTDHPRLCGEYAKIRSIPCLLLGSSPPVRGILTYLERSLRLHWIIPACAGNTLRKPL